MIPQIHAESSAKRYGGIPEDYLDIHVLLDSTKACYSNNAHRIFTHNSWFSTAVIPLIFGQQRVNSDKKTYSTKDVAEYHILEDFRNQFIPTPQDWLEHLELQDWMNNGKDTPNRLKRKHSSKKEIFDLNNLGKYIENSPIPIIPRQIPVPLSERDSFRD